MLRFLNWKRLAAAFLLFLVVAIITLISVLKPQQSVALKDGTKLVLTGLKVSATPGFFHGNTMQKMIAPYLPVKGLQIAGFGIKPPHIVYYPHLNGKTHLFIEFELRGESGALTNSALLKPAAHLRYRLVHWGVDNFKYAEVLDLFRNYPGGIFSYAVTTTFSRDTKIFNLQVEERHPITQEWMEIANFQIENPQPTFPVNWIDEDFPVAKSNGLFKAVLGEVQVQQGWFKLPLDFWRHTVQIPFQFFYKGQPVTNWTVQSMILTDSTGNEQWLNPPRQSAGRQVFYHGHRSLDPRTTWKLTAAFSRDSEYEPSQILNASIPMGSLTRTNFRGVNVQFDPTLPGMLDVSLPDGNRDARLVFISAKLHDGRLIQKPTGSAGPLGFFICDGALNPDVQLTFALVQNISLEFVFQPRLVNEIAVPDEL